MTKSKTIFYQAQEAVVSALSQDEVLSGRVPFVSENQLDIDFQIKNALGKQGIVGVVMTPQATYQGTYQGQDQVWDLRDFTVQVVENPIVNRTLSASRDPMTAFDAVTRATEVLASPLSPVWGQYCPTTIEQGEDNGLIVAQTKFDCQIRADKGPEKNTKWKYAGSDEWHEALVEGEFTRSSLPDIVDISEIEIGYSVTSIGDSAIAGTRLTRITLPDSVTSIKAYAFSGSGSLVSLTIPDSVTSIGDSAFGGCAGLTSMTIPDSVTSIGDYVFQDCNSLTSVVIGNGLTTIGDRTFRGCTSLQSVTIPDSVTNIGVGVFSGCSGLIGVTIPDSVTSIGDWAFFNCHGLTSVTIPDSVTSIGEAAFFNCRSLTSVVIPDSVTSIDNNAFERCFGLSSIEFGDSLSSIGTGAFTKCSSLVEATLPESVESIGTNAFSNCTSMTQLLLEGKTDRQVKAMENYSWGLPEGVARGAVIETFNINWYVTDGTTSSVPGGYVAGDTIRFDTDDASKSLQFVSVNGVEISDTSVYGQSFYEYVVQEEDVFLQVTFAVHQAKATFSFTGTNVSCDLPDGEYLAGMTVNMQALPLSNALSVEQNSMMSAMYVNGVLDLDVARSFGRPSLSATTWQYVLKEGENTVSASADLLPYCKDRTHFWVGYNSSNGVLSWRSCVKRDFTVSGSDHSLYITGPERLPNYSGSGYTPKTFEWTTPYGDAVDWTDIEEVFVPCAVYCTFTGAQPSGVYLLPGAFANMPSLRKVKFDCMRPSDPHWTSYGNRGNGLNWSYDSVCLTQGTVSNSLNGATLVFYNSPNLEEVDFSYDEGGMFRFPNYIATQPLRFVNFFYGTKLKELKLRLFCSAGSSDGSLPNFYFTEYLNGIRNYDGTFKLVLDYVKKSDGYKVDCNPLPIGNLPPVSHTGSIPKYRPKIGEIQYPYMSERQLAVVSAWTSAANRNICTTAATRAAASEGLSTMIIPNWASNAVIGNNSFLNPSNTLREIVLLSGDTMLSTTAKYWPSRELTSLAQLSVNEMPCSPLPHVSVYVPDSLYTQFQTDAQWSQLSSKGYDLKPVSTWPRLNPGT